MVLRDRLTVVDVWFGFQVDGKLASKCRTGSSPGQWNVDGDGVYKGWWYFVLS